MNGRLSVLGVCLLGVSFMGCGGDVPRGNVIGKVYVGEKLATAGEVKLHGSNGQVVGAQIQSDGSFKALAVPAGDVKVTVLPAPVLMSKTAAPKGVETISAGEGDTTPDSSSKSPPIPLKYATADSSGLSLTVNKGDNHYYFTPETLFQQEGNLCIVPWSAQIHGRKPCQGRPPD